MDTPPKIENAGLLTTRFGLWPTFHDAEVISVQLNRDSVTLTATVYVFLRSGETDDAGFYKRERESIVTLLFVDLEDLELSSFNHQNVLQALLLEPEGTKLRVSFVGIYGVQIRFLCSHARVLEVLPLGV